MNKENRSLVIDELAEFEKSPIGVQYYKKIASRFRGIYTIYSN